MTDEEAQTANRAAHRGTGHTFPSGYTDGG